MKENFFLSETSQLNSDVTGTVPRVDSGIWSGATTVHPERSTQSIDPAVAGRYAMKGTGIMRLPLRPHTDLMGSPAVFASLGGQRYRWDYVAVKLTAASNIANSHGCSITLEESKSVVLR